MAVESHRLLVHRALEDRKPDAMRGAADRPVDVTGHDVPHIAISVQQIEKCGLVLEPDAVHAAEADFVRGMMHEDQDVTSFGARERVLQPTQSIAAKQSVMNFAMIVGRSVERIETDEPPIADIDDALHETVRIERGIVENLDEALAAIMISDQDRLRHREPVEGIAGDPIRFAVTDVCDVTSDDDAIGISIVRIDVVDCSGQALNRRYAENGLSRRNDVKIGQDDQFQISLQSHCDPYRPF